MNARTKFEVRIFTRSCAVTLNNASESDYIGLTD